MKTLRFGIIGCGLMGKEFASAISRWMHISADVTRPEIVAVADTNAGAMQWFLHNVPSVRFHTEHYEALLERDDVDAVYCAVPHMLHERIYIDVIRAGKHLMGEKPFGINLEANERILTALAENPSVFCRCCSQFPYYPAMKRFEEWIEDGAFGRILDVQAGFLHGSDMDTAKRINWKRMASINGVYGCMGDLGMHVLHIPLRYGWLPRRLTAVLSDIVRERPDAQGRMTRCDTCDNAVLLCRTAGPDGETFPMTLETKRMSPGSTNVWYLHVNGLKASARYSTDDPGAFRYLVSGGKEQAWSRVSVGYKPHFPAITGDIFEFGFSDAVLQMWFAFMTEFDGKPLKFGCVRPEETRLSHRILTAAVRSQQNECEEIVNIN
jgi:predicted dehydrogenase